MTGWRLSKRAPRPSAVFEGYVDRNGKGSSGQEQLCTITETQGLEGRKTGTANNGTGSSTDWGYLVLDEQLLDGCAT